MGGPWGGGPGVVTPLGGSPFTQTHPTRVRGSTPWCRPGWGRAFGRLGKVQWVGQAAGAGLVGWGPKFRSFVSLAVAAVVAAACLL